MAADEAGDDKNKSKYSAARWVGNPDIEKIQDQFLAVLKREAKQLLEESYEKKLSPESSKSLINYLKLIKDMNKAEEPDPSKSDEPEEEEGDDFSQLSTEELKKMATKPKGET